MIQTDYSADVEYEISIRLLRQRYNEALDRIDSLNGIVSDLVKIMYTDGVPIPEKIQEQLDLDAPIFEN